MAESKSNLFNPEAPSKRIRACYYHPYNSKTTTIHKHCDKNHTKETPIPNTSKSHHNRYNVYGMVWSRLSCRFRTIVSVFRGPLSSPKHIRSPPALRGPRMFTLFVLQWWCITSFVFYITIRSENRGLEEIWNEHCKDETVLKQYAECMYRLATDHWTSQPRTRIEWCRDIIRLYYRGGGLQKCLLKDHRRTTK